MFNIYGAIEQIRLEQQWQAPKNHTNFINKNVVEIEQKSEKYVKSNHGIIF